MFYDEIEGFRNNVALFLDQTNQIFYRDIVDISEEFQKKIRRRSLTILITENSIECICGYISLLRGNNPLILLDSRIRNKDLKFIIDKFAPHFIFCSISSQKKLPNNLFNLIYSFKGFNLLKAKKNLSYKINDQLMILIGTSGSLAEPKFVKLSYRNIHANTQSIISYLNLKSSDRSITTMPMSYSYGFSVINTHLACGGSIAPNNYSLVDNKFWKFYSDSAPSNINGVPFFYDILDKVGFEKILGKKLKFLTLAGGKVEKKTFQNIANNCLQNDISFFLMYGQTEASPRISYHKVTKEDLDKNNIPIGKAIPEGQIILRSDSDLIIKDQNIEGELIYKGKNIFGGYAKSYEDLNSFDNKLELKTGDIGIKNKDGNFYITGRKNRFVKIYGYRVNLDYLEEKLSSKDSTVACIGINEKIYIFLSKKMSKMESIIDLPKNTYSVLVLKKFPLNDNGKISYNDLANMVS
tara:strand:+ start:282 stop:1682 length:1401 start_codon:yes stop_codon:yes gene_type:complete